MLNSEPVPRRTEWRPTPDEIAILNERIDAQALALEQRACEDSLIEFTRQAWSHIGESGEFIVNWHHEQLAADLESLAYGEVRDEIFNVPPRTTKSILCSIMFPAWVWAQPEERWGALLGPHVKFLCVSYGATLAEDMAVKMRRLVMGEWYQRRWGRQVQIHPDQASRANFGNLAGGERISCSIEGGILGRGGDCQIIDDPHSVKGAESETQRRETIEGMRALSNRITDPRRSARVLIMQRLHSDDATNYALDNWRPDLLHRWFPMRFDESRPCPVDVREHDGQLLWSDVWGEAAVAQEERELGPYMCSPGESPVLMADLSLRPISEVRAGDTVVGFSTFHSLSVTPLDGGPPPRRKLERAEVRQVFRYRAPVVKITMASGRTVRCTRGHLWYQKSRGPTRPLYRPAKIGRKLGMVCPAALPTLTRDEHRDAGWLGGFFDGEGSVSLSKTIMGGRVYRASGGIHFYQGAGRNLALCEKLERLLTYFGFSYSYVEDERKDNKAAACYGYRNYQVLGSGLPLMQRFLHVVQPTKWRDRIIEAAYGSKFIKKWDEIVSIEPDGEEPVFALETTTGNYVVWGYASSNSAGQLQQAPVPRGGGIIKREWWRLWPDDAEQEAGQTAQYRCDGCGWQGERLQFDSSIECPQCGRTAERRIVFPPTSFRLLTVDTGIGDREVNSWSAATLWGVWHGKEEAPRLMLMDAWRGRPMLRGGATGQRGLVEIITSMANRRLVDTVLIERKTRGVDLYNELGRQFRDHPWSLEFFEPTGRGDKAARLSSVQPLFTNELIWAPNKQWAEMVITEVCEAPFGRSDDLCDCTSMGLLYLRDTNRLAMSHEHAAEVRRARIFRPRSSRFNASEIFEGA